MKIVGIVPARMGSSRFPGKPLHPILGRPMVEHVFLRARLYERFDALALATCDEQIADFGRAKGWPVIMTSDKHTRAMDRVCEAAEKCGVTLDADDLVLCVQGDEPMLGPDVIDAVVKPFEADPSVKGTMLAVPIMDEELFLNPDTVKLVHDLRGNVLYTSRAPIPYCKPGAFSSKLGAKRVGGVFGCRWSFLQWFTQTPESPLEIAESCDSNRFYDHGFQQRAAEMPYRDYFSVDSPEDVELVEAALLRDPLWGRY